MSIFSTIISTRRVLCPRRRFWKGHRASSRNALHLRPALPAAYWCAPTVAPSGAPLLPAPTETRPFRLRMGTEGDVRS